MTLSAMTRRFRTVDPLDLERGELAELDAGEAEHEHLETVTTDSP